MAKKSGTSQGKPDSASKRPAAVEPQPAAQTVAGGILAQAKGIPRGIEAPKGGWHEYHRISVRKDPDGLFRLYSREEICGSRLIKGQIEPGTNHERGFPFSDGPDPWWSYGDLAEAMIAAQRLQDYLDDYENPKLPAARRRYQAEAAEISL